MMTAWLSAPSTSLLQILLHHRAQVLAQIGARHAEGDIGAEEAGLGAAIVPLALEFDAIEALGFLKPNHRIGELDLAAGAVFQRFQDLEDLRLQNVAPGDRQIRWRGALGRLLHHAVDLRSEEHTSELQSQFHLVCRLLLEKKKNKTQPTLNLIKKKKNNK